MSSKKPIVLLVAVTLVLAFVLSACGDPADKPKSEETFMSVRLTGQTLSQGQHFDLELSFENKRATNINVESIVLPSVFVQAVNLLGTHPAMPRAINSQGDWVFDYQRKIAPEGKERVSFSFETVSNGRFDGLGQVKTREQTQNFDLHLSVVGVNPVGWKPGAAKPLPDDPSEVDPALSVVKIDAMAEVKGQRMLVWSGSGTIISPDGLILTSADLVLSDRYFQVSELVVSLSVDPQNAPVPTYHAAIVQADLNLGLAVIKPWETLSGKSLEYAFLDLPAIPLGDSTAVEQGQGLQALGYVNLKDDPLLQLSMINVNDFGAEFPFGERVLIHASEALPAGMNGAPVLNESGKLVAVPVHKSPITFDPNTVECKVLVDANRDGRMDGLDPCHHVNLPIDTLRPIHVALPLIEAARRGEVKIVSASHNEGLQQAPGVLAGLDDFSDNQNHWKVEKNAAGEQSFLGGMYLNRLNEASAFLVSTVDFAYEDMLLETDVRLIAPTDSGEMGLVCGARNDEMTVFAISENGYYAIWRMKGDQMRYLYEWRYSPLIDTRDVLRLSARCNRATLELAVNGTVLTRVADPTFMPGLSGLYVASWQKDGLLVGFDSFSVSIPE